MSMKHLFILDCLYCCGYLFAWGFVAFDGAFDPNKDFLPLFDSIIVLLMLFQRSQASSESWL